MSSAPIEIASTIQAAHIKRNPSPAHDINPSTATSARVPVQPVTRPSADSSSLPSSPNFSPPPTLRPRRRNPPRNLPPLPDLRFEQSYLASLRNASTWYQIAWITARDQLFLPLIQGTLWTLALAGWKHWNTGARFAGEGIGARVRRWWWGVNDWPLPKERPAKRFVREVREATKGALSGMGAAESERKIGVW